MTDVPNADQKDFWTNQAGPNWVRYQEEMDINMQPVLDGVLDRASLQPGMRVLDIGCGTGTSTFQAAEQVAPGGHVTGLDISHTMLEAAQQAGARQDNVSFQLADAATHDFGAPRYDAMISRFGVMFFDDPVEAFANMSRALNPGARIVCGCWGQIPNNPFFATPAAVTRSVLGDMPKVDPDAPGPFAFRDPDRVMGILSDAGLQNVGCDVASLHLTPKGGAEAFTDVLMKVGQLDRAIRHFEPTPQDTARLREETIKAMGAFVQNGVLMIPAEINYFTAQMP